MRFIGKMFDLSPEAIEFLDKLAKPLTKDEVFKVNDLIWKALDDGLLTKEEHSFLVVKRVLAKLGEVESSQG